MTAGSKARWRIAGLMDRLPGQCWANLAGWALASDEQLAANDENRLPWRPVTDVCRSDLSGVGSCYCNKLDPDTGKGRSRRSVR